MSSQKDLLPANVEIIDPIGEIRMRAKELWAIAGKPENKPWESFFAQAERDLVAGVSDGIASQRARPEPQEAAIDPSLHKLADSTDDELLSTIINALKIQLTEHDAVCLARILTTHTIELPSQKISGPLTLYEAAKYLASLAEEYSNDFLQKHGNNIESIPLDVRRSYWDERLSSIALQDEPLSNTDLNTMDRIKFSLVKDGLVRELKRNKEK